MRVDQALLENIDVRLGWLRSRLGPEGGTQTAEMNAVRDLSQIVGDIVKAMRQGVEWDDLAPRPAPMGHPDVIAPKGHQHVWLRESDTPAAMDICVHCGERRYPVGANKPL